MSTESERARATLAAKARMAAALADARQQQMERGSRDPRANAENIANLRAKAADMAERAAK